MPTTIYCSAYTGVSMCIKAGRTRAYEQGYLSAVRMQLMNNVWVNELFKIMYLISKLI